MGGVRGRFVLLSCEFYKGDKENARVNPAFSGSINFLEREESCSTGFPTIYCSQQKQTGIRSLFLKSNFTAALGYFSGFQNPAIGSQQLDTSGLPRRKCNPVTICISGYSKSIGFTGNFIVC